jgi:hypothetical protein
MTHQRNGHKMVCCNNLLSLMISFFVPRAPGLCFVVVWPFFLHARANGRTDTNCFGVFIFSWHCCWVGCVFFLLRLSPFPSSRCLALPLSDHSVVVGGPARSPSPTCTSTNPSLALPLPLSLPPSPLFVCASCSIAPPHQPLAPRKGCARGKTTNNHTHTYTQHHHHHHHPSLPNPQNKSFFAV